LPWSPLAFGFLAGKYDRNGGSAEKARFVGLDEKDFLVGWKARYFNDHGFDVVDVLREEAERNGTTCVALAIRWLLEQPNVTSVIIGPRSLEQLEGNLAAVDVQPQEATMERLEETTEPVESYLDFMQAKTFAPRLADLED
jgi:aryl-alcohol dehydrogenase (NADP+)